MEQCHWSMELNVHDVEDHAMEIRRIILMDFTKYQSTSASATGSGNSISSSSKFVEGSTLNLLDSPNDEKTYDLCKLHFAIITCSINGIKINLRNNTHDCYWISVNWKSNN